MKCLSLLLVILEVLSSSIAREHFQKGYNEFTADVYKKMLAINSGNFIVCPLSVDIVLALAESGARGKTAKEMKSVLRLPKNRKRIHKIFRNITPCLDSNEPYTLKSANKIYLTDKYVINDHFKNISVTVFNSELETVDFVDNEKSANKINQWVKEQTNGKIKDIINAGALDDHTFAVLVNAIYFHGKWSNGFDKRYTSQSIFHLNSKDEIETNMMNATSDYSFFWSKELEAQFLKLEYIGDDVSMHIVLPDDWEGLAALEEKISDVLVPPEYETTRVNVRIPKFKMETKIPFKSILKKMGIKIAFIKGIADFQGMVDNDIKGYISEVTQKAFIEVDEEGTTAAAVTTVEVGGFKSISDLGKLKLFHANHPFLFYLRLDKLGVNLFVGRFISP
ncbi:hypothetical protein ILUMI_06949 [Ignelater luminosus]|uniref:Serpin domain-containing protein n=1 Tax=Ignelater luminosus TaxID=2038154 RepID=A0A8K0D4E5_IGNLU|nr:hypothetical protein ILUMI_06949 [Ignelater luminosus]